MNSSVAPDPTEAAPSNALQPTAGRDARPVRYGIDGEHGMDACHTQGRISGQDSVSVQSTPDQAAAQIDSTEPGLDIDICETIPGWYGIVYRNTGDPEWECGLGENLPGPRDYPGPCRSGWVPENNIEVTAG